MHATSQAHDSEQTTGPAQVPGPKHMMSHGPGPQVIESMQPPPHVTLHSSVSLVHVIGSVQLGGPAQSIVHGPLPHVIGPEQLSGATQSIVHGPLPHVISPAHEPEPMHSKSHPFPSVQSNGPKHRAV